MGQAKQRGSFEERKAAAIANKTVTAVSLNKPVVKKVKQQDAYVVRNGTKTRTNRHLISTLIAMATYGFK